MFSNMHPLTVQRLNLLLPAMRILCYVRVGYIIGRRVTLGISGNSVVAAAKIADLLKNKELSAAWRKRGEDYSFLARKDLGRDIRLIGCLLLVGLILEDLENMVALQLATNEAANFSNRFYKLFSRVLNPSKPLANSFVESPFVQGVKEFLLYDFRLTARVRIL